MFLLVLSISNRSIYLLFIFQENILLLFCLFFFSKNLLKIYLVDKIFCGIFSRPKQREKCWYKSRNFLLLIYNSTSIFSKKKKFFFFFFWFTLSHLVWQTKNEVSKKRAFFCFFLFSLVIFFFWFVCKHILHSYFTSFKNPSNIHK